MDELIKLRKKVSELERNEHLHKETEKKLQAANQQLQASEERLRIVIDNSPFPTAVVDEKDQTILFWSKSAIELFGHDPKTTEEWYELSYPNPEYRQKVIERWKSFLEIAQKTTNAINTGEYEIQCKNGSVKICELYAQFIPGSLIVTLNDITDRKKTEEHLKKIEWLLQPKKKKPEIRMPDYGDLTILNQNRTILDSVGKEVLNGIVNDYLSLLETSAAVYEKNGDYAVGIFSSEWCQFMDCSSRALCKSKDNRKALESGKWLCHESCWTNASSQSIQTNKAVDIECSGGLHIYAIPIRANNKVIGSINFGYGNPPADNVKLKEIAANYKVSTDKLKSLARNYETRPAFIIDIAKEKLETSARLIGTIVERKQMEEKLLKNQIRYQKAQALGHVGNWEYDPVTTKFWASDEAKRIYGFKLNTVDFSTEMVESCIPERERVRQALLDLLEHNKKYDLVFDIITNDKGIRKTIHSIAEVERDAKGNPLKITGVINDITIQKKADDHLRSMNQQLKANEQQLRAANQQLQASEQQLKAANQQLQANEQQLRAANLQLRASEQQLRAANEELNKVQEITHSGSWYLDTKTNKVTWTEELYKMYGFDPAEPVPPYTEHMKLFTPESWEMLSFSIEHTNKTGDPYELELKTIRDDKSNDWMWVRGEAVFDENKKIVGLWGAAQDITERKNLEIELQKAKEKAEENEIKFKAAFYTSPDAVNINKLDGEYVEINEGFTRLTGYTKEDVTGKLSTEINIWAIPKDRKKLVDALQKYGVIENLESLFKGKDGSLIPALMSAKIVTLNNKPYILSVTRNISEHKKSEQELIKAKEKAEQNETRFNLAMKASNDGLFDWNLETNEIYYSPGWKKMIGYEDYEIPNDFSIWEKTTAPDDVKKSWEMQQKLITKQIDRFVMEFKMKHKNGHWVDVLARAEAIFNDDGKAVRIVGTHVDISERRKIELELIAAKEKAVESDRLKSAFLANMSHEIRTPMNGILGFSNLLKEQKLTGQQQKEYIDIIEKSGSRMLNIINDIVDISKIEAGLMSLDIKESNINEQIEYIYTFFKPEVEAKGIKFSYRSTLPDKEAIIKTDREKIFAILTNLVKNAIKYTNEGSIEFGYNKKGNYLEFLVKDTGIGIPGNRQSAIFERFIQGDIEDKMARQGAGLGLAITKAYIELLGGRIWVESQEGKGSIFYFTIPYNATFKKKTEADIIDVGDDSLIPDLKILIVEDDETSSLLLSIIMGKYGKEIINVSNGIEALETCRKNPDIDLILMDIQIPEMDGYEVTRQIRKFNKEVIIIAQTAYGLTGDREKAINAGCNDYISKPVNEEEFGALIRKHFKN